MNPKRLFSLALIIVMVMGLFAGCGDSTGSGSQQGSTPAPSQDQGGGTTETPSGGESSGKDTLVVGQASDATTMDPQKQGKMPDMNILINIFDTLVTRDENGQLAPSLATEWEAIDDVTWQFKLREGVKFHNGEDFNAEAVKFSMDRLMDPATESPIAELRNMVACNVVDEYTVNIVTEAPDPIIPNKMVIFGGVIMPPQYVQENDPEFVAKNPVGTGPYKFVSWQKDAEVVMVANEDYWRGAPAFQNLIFRIIPNWADIVAALRTGEVDIVQGLPSDSAQALQSADNLEIISSDWIRTFFVSLDTAVEPLNIKEVRQAMNYAVDKEAIINTIFGGSAKQVSTVIPRENFGYDPSIEPYPYDPEKAKELLTAAGYPDGFTIGMDVTSSEATEIQAIVGYLEAVGINIDMNMTDSATLVANMQAKTAGPLYHIGNTGWTMDALSNFQSYAHTERRYARGGNDELDALVIVEETTIDPDTRQEAFTKAQEILKEEAYFIYLWQQDNLLAVSKDVSYIPDKIGILWMYNAKHA